MHYGFVVVGNMASGWCRLQNPTRTKRNFGIYWIWGWVGVSPGNARKLRIRYEIIYYFALQIILMLRIIGTSYWTSGMFDPSRNLWRWTSNNQALPPFAPWSPGFPSNPNQLLRVNLAYTNRFDAWWQTQPNTQLRRYICEVWILWIHISNCLFFRSVVNSKKNLAANSNYSSTMLRNKWFSYCAGCIW